MRRMHSLAAALVVLVIGCASGQTVKLNGSPQVPAAQGVAYATSGANNNTRLKVTVHHLARPE